MRSGALIERAIEHEDEIIAMLRWQQKLESERNTVVNTRQIRFKESEKSILQIDEYEDEIIAQVAAEAGVAPRFPFPHL